MQVCIMKTWNFVYENIFCFLSKRLLFYIEIIYLIKSPLWASIPAQNKIYC
jgi:hypothetical protein